MYLHDPFSGYDDIDEAVINVNEDSHSYYEEMKSAETDYRKDCSND